MEKYAIDDGSSRTKICGKKPLGTINSDPKGKDHKMIWIPKKQNTKEKLSFSRKRKEKGLETKNPRIQKYNKPDKEHHMYLENPKFSCISRGKEQCLQCRNDLPKEPRYAKTGIATSPPERTPTHE